MLQLDGLPTEGTLRRRDLGVVVGTQRRRCRWKLSALGRSLWRSFWKKLRAEDELFDRPAAPPDGSLRHQTTTDEVEDCIDDGAGWYDDGKGGSVSFRSVYAAASLSNFDHLHLAYNVGAFSSRLRGSLPTPRYRR